MAKLIYSSWWMGGKASIRKGAGVLVCVGRGRGVGKVYVGNRVEDGVGALVGEAVSVGCVVLVGMGTGVLVWDSFLFVGEAVRVGIRGGDPGGVRVSKFGTYITCPV